MNLKDIIQKRKILIVFGTGGVGKTTTSAALALAAALEGKRAIVITIDPAKRLVTSLGLKQLGDKPENLSEKIRELLKKNNVSLTGEFSALMPDTKATFHHFVDKVLPENKSLSEKIKINPICEILATEYSGANEYMALHKLNTFDQISDYDFIVLDTPPSRNALGFIHAPKVLARFFDEKLIKWLVLPSNKILATGVKKAFSLLEKLTGSGFLSHMFELAAAGAEVQDKLIYDIKEISQLLESEKVGYFMVSSPNPESIPETVHLLETFQKNHLHLDGMALNRSLNYIKITEDEKTLAQSLAQKNHPQLLEGLKILESLQNKEKQVTQNLFQQFQKLNDIFIKKVPELSRDIHCMEDLLHVTMALSGDSNFDTHS